MSMRRIACFLLLLTLLLYTQSNRTLWAAPVRQIVTVQGPVLRGELPYQYNAHYLGLAPVIRDSMVSLTLAYDPQNNPNLQGFVNFFVLDEDGLRRFLAGSDPQSLAIAGGAPLQFDPIGNKMGAAFLASGRGQYTVVVYNNSQLPVQYTLTTAGGILIDNANQTLVTTTAAPLDTTQTPPVVTATPAPTAAPVNNPLGSATGQRLRGVLSNTIGRHYLEAVPGVRDGTILFSFRYDPLDQPALYGNVNFWVLDQAGLNAIVRGDKPGDVNLATGFPLPFSPFPNELQANFNASGKDPYTVVIYNQTAIPATYDLAIDGGQLSDRFGQTVEAKAAASPASTISPLAPITTVNDPTALTLVSNRQPIAAAADPTATLPLGVAQLAGNFRGAYQYHYFALQPTLRDGTVVLSLAFEPRDSQALRENLNFWVLTEDGLRRVIAGGPPTAYDIATGAYQDFGPYKGQLYAAFNASGHGNYTVIVFSNTDQPSRYLLSAQGGLLATEDVNVTLP
jgi:hypothetical protein